MDNHSATDSATGKASEIIRPIERAAHDRQRPSVASVFAAHAAAMIARPAAPLLRNPITRRFVGGWKAPNNQYTPHQGSKQAAKAAARLARSVQSSVDGIVQPKT